MGFRIILYLAFGHYPKHGEIMSKGPYASHSPLHY